MIDDQVHFREPGLTHKGNISSESKAAIAGGVTSYIEMPNTSPNTTTIEEFNKKISIASIDSYSNFSFMFGGTNDNLDEIKKIDPTEVAGIKLFLGSSTGKMLIDNLNSIEKFFHQHLCQYLLIVKMNKQLKIIQKNIKKSMVKMFQWNVTQRLEV